MQCGCRFRTCRLVGGADNTYERGGAKAKAKARTRNFPSFPCCSDFKTFLRNGTACHRICHLCWNVHFSSGRRVLAVDNKSATYYLDPGAPARDGNIEFYYLAQLSDFKSCLFRGRTTC